MFKRFFFILIALMAVAAMAATSAVTGMFMDLRDGKKYKTVKIGNQTWMAENLNYETEGSFCYENKPANCKKYGRLYTWNAALKACPVGWHLPNKTEFEKLIEFVGGEEIAAEKLKAQSSWTYASVGTDDFGFSALSGGKRDDHENYYDEGGDAFFWSSTGNDEKDYLAKYMHIYFSNANVYVYDCRKGFSYSVRCIKD